MQANFRQPEVTFVPRGGHSASAISLAALGLAPRAKAKRDRADCTKSQVALGYFRFNAGGGGRWNAKHLVDVGFD